MTPAMGALFDQLAALAADRKRPPVASWNPDRIGHIDIRIAADGTWYHEGGAFQRPALVRLFASILRRDPEGYCLVTPAEKLFITVEDTPFLAIDMETKGEGAEQSLLFVTNVEDCVIADSAHPLRMRELNGELRPYIMVRDGLEAKLTRPVYYRLVERAVQEGAEAVVYSRGARFVLGRF